MTLPMIRPRCVGRFTEVIGFDPAPAEGRALRVEGVNARPAGRGPAQASMPIRHGRQLATARRTDSRTTSSSVDGTLDALVALSQPVSVSDVAFVFCL
jgi:uncharacterized iron-regulated protein